MHDPKSNLSGGVGAGFDDDPGRVALDRPTDHRLAAPSESLAGRDIAAIVLSIAFPGLGHALIGQPLKGVSSFLSIAAFTAIFGVLTCGLGFYIYPIFMALFGVDAFMVATARKKRPVGPLAFFPSD